MTLRSEKCRYRRRRLCSTTVRDRVARFRDCGYFLDSTGRCNTGLKQGYLVVECLGWCLPFEDLPGSAVDGHFDSCEVLRGPAGQVRALGKVLAQDPIGVLVRPSLPR